MPDHNRSLYDDNSSHGISLDQLQRRLHHRLETTGVLDQLRAQLRKLILSELRGAGARSCDDQSKQYSSADRAFNVVVADFLSRYEHSYALSVFLSESATDPDVFKICDLERIFNLPEQSLESNIASKSILAAIIELAARLNRNSNSCSVQTEGSSDDMLESSLRLLDQKFKRLSYEEDEATKRSYEERIATQIRQIEQRAAETLKQETERIRITEIAAVRISENEKYQDELNAIRQSFEKQYQERLEQLRIQEQEQDRQLQKRKQTLEALEYQRRQQLLSEIETIRLRDIDLKRGVELERRALQLERESLHKELEDAKRRADVFEKELERKAYARELNAAEYDTSYRYLQNQEKLQLEYVIRDYNEKRKWLDQESEAFQKCKIDLLEAQNELKQQEFELQELKALRANLNEANVKLNVLKKELHQVYELKQASELKLTQSNEQAEKLRLKVGSLEGQLQDEKVNYESSVANIKSEHEMTLKILKSENIKQQKALQNQILTLSKELQDRLDEDERIQLRYEEEQIRCKSLSREIVRLKNEIDEMNVRNRSAFLTAKKLELMQSQAQRLQYNSQRGTDTVCTMQLPQFSFIEKPEDQVRKHVNKENISESLAPTPTTNENNDPVLKNEEQSYVKQMSNESSLDSREQAFKTNVIRSNDSVQEPGHLECITNEQDAHEITEVPEHLQTSMANVATDSQAPNLSNREATVMDAQRSSINHPTDLASYLPKSNDDLDAPKVIALPESFIKEASVRTPGTHLASYLPNSIDVLQKYEQVDKFEDLKSEKVDEQLPSARGDPSEGDFRRQEAAQKRREEMILRAAQQRKERDERERRERLLVRKSALPSSLNNMTVNRAPPVKRNLNIEDN